MSSTFHLVAGLPDSKKKISNKMGETTSCHHEEKKKKPHTQKNKNPFRLFFWFVGKMKMKNEKNKYSPQKKNSISRLRTDVVVVDKRKRWAHSIKNGRFFRCINNVRFGKKENRPCYQCHFLYQRGHRVQWPLLFKKKIAKNSISKLRT